LVKEGWGEGGKAGEAPQKQSHLGHTGKQHSIVVSYRWG
jgi:hypothetical protein